VERPSKIQKLCETLNVLQAALEKVNGESQEEIDRVLAKTHIVLASVVSNNNSGATRAQPTTAYRSMMQRMLSSSPNVQPNRSVSESRQANFENIQQPSIKSPKQDFNKAIPFAVVSLVFLGLLVFAVVNSANDQSGNDEFARNHTVVNTSEQICKRPPPTASAEPTCNSNMPQSEPVQQMQCQPVSVQPAPTNHNTLGEQVAKSDTAFFIYTIGIMMLGLIVGHVLRTITEIVKFAIMVILCMVLICVGVALLCVFMFFYITFLLPRVQNDIIVATGTTIGYFVLVGLLIWSLLTSLSDTYASGKK
jgi:hypothetical protein